MVSASGCEILSAPVNSVPQTVVFRNTEIGDKLCGKHRKKVMFLSKYPLDRNNTIASLFRTQYTPDFLIAEYYGLRNTIFWVTEDLADLYPVTGAIRNQRGLRRGYGSWVYLDSEVKSVIFLNAI
jgi:hypothetical protein